MNGRTFSPNPRKRGKKPPPPLHMVYELTDRFCFQGSGLLAYTMFIELLPKWLRGAAVLIDGTVWSCCVMLLPLLAYLMQDYSWRYLQLVLAAFSAYSIILPWLVEATLEANPMITFQLCLLYKTLVCVFFFTPSLFTCFLHSAVSERN